MKAILMLLASLLVVNMGRGQNCNAPSISDLSADNNGNNSSTLNCSVPNKHAYEWRIRILGTNNWNNLGTTNYGTIPVEVDPGLTYQYQCRVECTANNFSPWSPSGSFTAACERIRNYEVHASNITASSALASTDIDGADAYEWRYPEPNWSDPVAPPPFRNFKSNGPSITLSGLTSRTTYDLSVRMRCGSDWTAWSTAIDFQTTCATAGSGDLEAEINSSTSATLKCNIPNADEYQFRYRQQGASNWTNIPKSNRDYIGLLQLQPEQTYEFQCQIWCNGVATGWSGTATFTMPDDCSAPSTVFTTFITTNSAKLTCARTSNSRKSDIIEYKNHFDAQWSVFPASTSGSIDVTNLDPATTYDCRCKSLCNDGSQSGYSPIVSFRTTHDFVCQVERVRDFYNADGLNIYFDHYPDLNGFIDLNYRIKGETVWSFSTKKTTSGNTDLLVTTTFLITPVEAGATYEYRYRINCSSTGWTSWSGINQVAIPPCEAPYALSTTEETTANDLVDVTIELFNGSTITDCECVGVETSSNAFIGGRKIAPNTWQFTQLLPNNRYSYQCRAKCNSNNPGWSDWGNVSTFATECANRRGNVSDVTSSTITVVCLPASDFAYNAYVHYRPAGSSFWQTSPRQTGNVVTLTGLTPETKYELQVKIDCHGSESYGPYSASFFATTLADPGTVITCDPPDVTNLYADQIATNTATIHCNVSGQAAYDFRVRVKGTPNFTDIPESANNSRSLPGLMPATEYEYQCRIKCTTSFSDWSASAFFTTEPEPVLLNECLAPKMTNLIIDQVSETQATVYCSLTADGYDFRIREAGTLSWTDHNDSDPGITFLGLTAGTTYQVESRLSCGTTKSDWSEPVSFTTSTESCDQPVLNQFRLIGRTAQSFEIETILTGFSGFEYRYRMTGMTEWNSIPISTSGYLLLNDLSPGITYDIQARILCDESHLSPWSKSVQLTTLSLCGIPGTDELTVEYVTDQSATLISNVEDVPVYDFRYRLAGSNTWIDLNPTRQGEQVVRDLEADKTYEFQNRVYCPGIGVSAWSASQTFHTAGQTTSVTSVSEGEWTIYPNPATAAFIIRAANIPSDSRICIHNLQGQLIRQIMLPEESEFQLQMHLEAGFYIVSIQSPGAIQSKKLIVR
ncbi:MAG TPA: T9SS type A sorting domain-containing protein [Saprospiraceae bacterium]|nr:T9SS type A sorting domain-containing protein [Saprospiraceae bacterium]HPG09046.1 T9SS type A sorting domain-containing protein [Saprospiraceae bacterium]HRV85715.1 T9SS type A sorting domain-containing protein [Saprospiraceae bacterium]